MFAELYAGIDTRAGALQKLYSEFKKWQLRMEMKAHRSKLLKVAAGVRMWKRQLFSTVMGHNSIMGWVYYHHLMRHRTALTRRLNLRTLYVHHRLVIIRIEGENL
jgi:hypothetical protein